VAGEARHASVGQHAERERGEVAPLGVADRHELDAASTSSSTVGGVAPLVVRPGAARQVARRRPATSRSAPEPGRRTAAA